MLGEIPIDIVAEQSVKQRKEVFDHVPSCFVVNMDVKAIAQKHDVVFRHIDDRRMGSIIPANVHDLAGDTINIKRSAVRDKQQRSRLVFANRTKSTT